MRHMQALLLCLLSTQLHASPESHTAGTLFRDCEHCPEMLVLPAGTFTMGSPSTEAGKHTDEEPLHPVTFAQPFAISRFPVTAEEWEIYAKDTGVILENGDTRPGRECINGKPRYPQGPRQPAVCVDYNDVRKYIDWLAEKTGKPYRMISEAEREYAARAGSEGPFPFDDKGTFDLTAHANTLGDADGYEYTSPVDAFPPNAFGVYDMHGNVYEWVADCWHLNYAGAPTDGSAWMDGECKHHHIRGNDWLSPSIFSRSANRNSRAPSTRGDWIGFRVARALND